MNSSDEDFTKAVKTSISYAQVIKKLGLHICGGNYTTVKNRIKELGLNKDHFLGKRWNKNNIANLNNGLKKPISYYLVENSTYVNSNVLKKRLIKEGYFSHKCYKCNRAIWMGQPIPIQIEHVNGVHTDNRIENITLLCPNCHAQTPTYCGKNIRTKKVNLSLGTDRKKTNYKKGSTLRRYKDLYKKEREDRDKTRSVYFKSIKELNRDTINVAVRLFSLSEKRIKELYRMYNNI